MRYHDYISKTISEEYKNNKRWTVKIGNASDIAGFSVWGAYPLENFAPPSEKLQP